MTGEGTGCGGRPAVRARGAGSQGGASSSSSSWRDFIPASLLLVIGVVGLLAATLAPSGRDDQYALIVPPWQNEGRTIAIIRAAGGEVVQTGRGGRIAVAHSHDPHFVRALYRAGAWLVVDPVKLRGCLGIVGRNDF